MWINVHCNDHFVHLSDSVSSSEIKLFRVITLVGGGTVERRPLLTFFHNLPVFLSQWMHVDDVSNTRHCNILNIKKNV